jgi:hypothetical protein
MSRTGKSTFAIAMALGVSLAVANIADAGGYVNNKCISKKQGALSKYIKSVSKAWDKNPSDAMARAAAIAAAHTKLSETWTKEEGKASDKGADCAASSDDFADLVALVDNAINTLAGATEDYGSAAGYAAGAIKARGKYIKDPVKDPGKAKMTASIAKATAKYLTDTMANATVVTAATTLENDLWVGTTTAPNYPTAFQSISPVGPITYGKKELNPGCVHGDPYMYWARKGTSNNLLMYYQGGGACWNDLTCFVANTCKKTATLADNPDLAGVGFADYDNPENPFSDWNVVFVSYCSCDVHWGEANDKVYGVQDPVDHLGRVNAAVAEKFAREHFLDPDRVVATGSSAGSYGAIMNSYYLMKEVWPNADYAVLGDAGVGVITQDFLDKYIDNWNITANFPEDLEGVALPVQNLSLVDLIDGLAGKFPAARFANYDASYDGGGGSQCQFFQAMNHPTGTLLASEGQKWWERCCTWNQCMRDFKAENASLKTNYKYYTDAGTRHTMFGSDKVYTVTKATNAAGTGVTIADWVQAMVDDTPAWENVDCNNLNGDCSHTNSCQGGPNAGAICTTNVDCNTGAGCMGGTNDGNPCTTGGDCPGGFCPFCQFDPDTAEPPFNNDGTTNCPASPCPCGLANASCQGGDNEGVACTTNTDCDVPNPGVDGTCQWVRCPE